MNLSILYKSYSNPEELDHFNDWFKSELKRSHNKSFVRVFNEFSDHPDAFKPVEEYIATDPNFSFFYASKVLNKRFPLGEPAIATNAWRSCLYAQYVIHGRFPAGEAIMRTCRSNWAEYLHYLRKCGIDTDAFQ